MIKFYSTSNLFNDSFESIFNDLFNESSFYKSKNYSPSMDIIENDNEYNIEVSLPGFNKEDVSIKLEKNILTIEGERKKDETLKFNKNQSYYGKFTKSFDVDNNIDQESINAEFKNGILTIKLKKSIKEIKKIEIK